MNAAARALAEGSFAVSNVRSFAFSARNLMISLLLMAVLISAFAVVSIKDTNRHLFSELAGLQQTRQELDVEWGQLLLEQNTWATQARVQQIAQDNLGMIVPAGQVLVK